MARKEKNRFYAYAVGPDRGIVTAWPECERRVSGKSGARYRGFPDRASAEAWLAGGPVGAEAARTPSRPRGFYAFRTDQDEGVVESWAECERRTRGRSARYRRFSDRASARAWLAAGARYQDRASDKASAVRQMPADSVFFDAGTGRGRGTEVKVVDRDGVPLLHLTDPPEGELTAEGTLLLGRGRTNNYGELLGCLLGLRAAAALGAKHLFGDSRLVLDYWSLGKVTKEKRDSDPAAYRLALETAAARRRFEAAGGVLGHVPGGVNPADLGFHKD